MWKVVGLMKANIREMMNNFCDYCSCDDCKYGSYFISHAKTLDGKQICDVCYTYDLCTSGPNRNSNGPCKEKNCIHRPKLISDWIKC